jgi:hypothetical protein
MFDLVTIVQLLGLLQRRISIPLGLKLRGRINLSQVAMVEGHWIGRESHRSAEVPAGHVPTPVSGLMMVVPNTD